MQWDRRKTNAGKGDYWACCPFHSEKTPSFHADDRRGRYHCFGCKESGDIFRFLTEQQGLSFPEAVEQLAGEAGLEMPKMTPEAVEREKRRASLYDVMELAAAFFEDKLQGAEGAAARGYLADRGLPARIIQDFRIGYAPGDRRALKTHLADNDITAEQMAEAGLVVTGEDIAVPYDRFRDRIMFPIRDGRGRVIAFGGRAMSADVPAKYLNSPEGPLFHKSAVLYNLDKAREPAHKSSSIIAVEGYMDVIAMTRAGLAQAVAPLGTALTQDQLTLMWRIAPEPVLCFDGDEAGLKAAYRALDLAIPLLRPGHSLKFALLPQDTDPDDLLTSEGADAVKAVIAAATPLVDILWRRALDGNDRATPEQRARLEQDLEQAVARIDDAKVRSHYHTEIANRLRGLWAPDNVRRPFGNSRNLRGRPNRPGSSVSRTGRFEPWRQAAPASAELRAMTGHTPDRRIAERRERLIVLSVINHPALLDDQAEQFAGVELSAPGLDSLRREIIDIAALGEGLETGHLRDHLSKRGKGSELIRLDAQAERLNCWFVRPDAALDDVRVCLDQMIALHRKTVTLERELKQAELALAETPNEANLLHLNEIRDQLLSSVHEEAAIDGFGEASGRPAGSVS